MSGLASAVSNVGNIIVQFIGTIITSLFGVDGPWADLLPFFLLGIMVSLVLVGVKIIRKVVWGS